MHGAQKGIRILHVDDEPDFLAATKALLERRNEDFRVDITISAEEGLKLLKSDNYDAVISDYQMSVMDGLEFLQKLRESGSTIPFIVFTGKGREEVAIEALNKGANHYLQKGGDRESLYKTLAHVVKEEVAKKRAEDKLVEKEREYQTLLNSLPLNIFHIDRNNTFVHVNEVLAKHYGMKPEDFKGRTTKELFPAETEAFTKSDKEVLESGKPQIGVRRKVVTPQGVQWVRLDKVPIKDAYGNVTGLIGFELDVTEQKRMEDELQESEQRLNSFMDSATDSFTLWDSEFNLIDINNAALDFFAKGSKKEELRGLHILDIVPYVKGTDAYDKFKTVIKTGQPLIADHIIHHPELGEVYLTVRAFKVGDGFGVIFRDITERKRAEEQLGKIIEGSTIPTFVINSEHKITHWNTAVEALTGIKRAEEVGTDKQWVAFYPEKRPVMADLIVDGVNEREFRNKYGAKYKKSALIEGAYEGLEFFPTLGEGGKWLDFSAAPIKDSTGSVIAALETIKDVTDQKRAEEALRESEERFRSIVENSHDGILIIDDAFHATYVNDELCRILGYSREECIGQDFRDFLDEKSKRLVADRYIRRQQGENIPARYEFTIVRKDGAKRQVEISSAVTKDSSGNVQTVAQILDATERKRAVEKLQRSEKEHQMVLDSVPVSIFHIDCNSNFVQVNETLANRYGLKPEDFKGRATNELFPEQANSFSDSDREVLESGVPQIGTIRKIKTPQGVRWVRLDKVPIKDADGNVTGIVGFELDITDRKETGDERKRLLKELEAKNEELEHFTYTVSHDLRSPLVTIQGFTGLLKMDLERDAKEKAENDLKYISSAAAKMDELLNATLELSRIGRIANPPEAVPFGKIVEGALQQTAGAITANNIEVSVVDGFPAVHVDRMRLEEVLVNLITNSIKYRGDQPHPKIEIGHRVDDEETVFFVKDNGIGIAKDQHEEVFELFHQERSGNGAGAGLAIVKRIIEVHKGRIWVESEIGKGCTICFTLPVSPTHATPD